MKMTRKMLKARIRVLESDLDFAATNAERRLTQLDEVLLAAVSLVGLKGCIDWIHVDCSARVLSYLSSVTSYLRQ